MTKSKIEWCHYTWNPITGCTNGCEYCYARALTRRFAGDIEANKKKYPTIIEGAHILGEKATDDKGNTLAFPFGFEPTIHNYRLNLPDIRGCKNIFVGAMTDICSDWIPQEVLKLIIYECIHNGQQHNFLFLTKNPLGYLNFPLRLAYSGELRNIWFGTTVTSLHDVYRTWKLYDVTNLNDISIKLNAFLSIEPLMSDININGLLKCAKQIKWVIIGAETGNRKNRVTVNPEWVHNIVESCKSNNVPIFMKKSLIPVMGEGNMLREYPDELKKNGGLTC